jgi:hypothetical protein
MVLAFLILAAIWVLAWVVLIVLGLVNILFPRSDVASTEDPGFFSDDTRAS